MPGARQSIVVAALVGALALPSVSRAAEVVGPPIGAKNSYRTSIEPQGGVVDTDDFVGALMEGERLSVTVKAGKKSGLKPTIVLIDPNDVTRTPELKIKKKGAVVSLRTPLPIDVTGTWAVRVSGTGGTAGEYTVGFKIKKAKPIKLKKRGLGGADPASRVHAFPGLDGALLTLVVKWKKTKTLQGVTLTKLADPQGDDVPSNPAKASDDAVPKGTKITLKKQILHDGHGNYAATIASAGTSSYGVTIKVTPQGRISSRRAVVLTPDEPFLQLQGGSVRAAVGFPVRLTGRNFSRDPAPTVLFDGVPGSNVVVQPGSTVIDATVPGLQEGATIDVVVQNPDGQAVARDDYVFVAPPPTIDRITDTAGRTILGGTTAGDQRVRIVGSGLVVQDTVRFGTTTVPVDAALTPNIVEVITPARPAGPTTVVVFDEFNRESLPGTAFEFKTPPTLRSAPPPYDPVISDPSTTPTVQIHGNGFLDDDTLFFDGQELAFTRLSGSVLSVVLPSRTQGEYTVRLVDRVGSQVDGPLYPFKRAPTITSVTVAAGAELAPGEIPIHGGNTLRVAGANFGATDTVAVGGTEVTVVTRTANSLDCLTPAHAAGPADLTITDIGNRVARRVNAVHYMGFAEATSTISPGGSATDDLSGTRGAIGDVDLDGRADDLVFASYDYGSSAAGRRYGAGYGSYNSPGMRLEFTRLLTGNGSGKLEDKTASGIPAQGSDTGAVDNWNGTAIAIGDLDKQNGPDIVVGGSHAYYTYYSDIRMLNSSGNTTFTYDATNTPPARYLPGYYVYPFYNGTIYTAYYFTIAYPRYTPGLPASIAIGDLDRDGDNDVVVARDAPDVTYFVFDPQYVNYATYNNNNYLVLNYQYILDNYNGVGYPNLYINRTYYYSGTLVLDNDIAGGNGLVDVTDTFTATGLPAPLAIPSAGTSAVAATPAFHARDMGLADIDRDFDLDIVVTWPDPTTVSAIGFFGGTDTARVATRVLENDGSGTFTDTTGSWLPSGSSPEHFQAHRMKLVDLDGDLDVDLVLLHALGLDAHLGTPTHNSSALRILRNDFPTKSFTDVTPTALPALETDRDDDNRGTALLVRDMDRDGAPDIAVGALETLQTSGGSRIRSTRLFMGTPNTISFRRATGFLPVVTADSGEADDLLAVGDLAGTTNPVLIILSEVTPTNSTNGEHLRTFEWER